MCGICGYFGIHDNLNPIVLRAMNEQITHRGPDDDGYFVSQGVGLAMRRLSILDIEHGKQPIFNEDNTVCTVYNGEIYNYRELKRSLESKGHVFRTNSDTEVIVHLYEEYGKDLVHHLRGMFALAVWDDRNRLLLLARDRLGIKPLFYSLVGGNVIFGSEIKCILASGLAPKRLNYQAVDAYFTYTYIPAPYTVYEDINKLEPGCLIVIDQAGMRHEQYWDLDFSRQDASKSSSEWQKTFDTAIYDSVSSHLVSDVPLGAFLSGGIDSSLIVAMMSKASEEDVEAFTIGFEESAASLLDERVYARMLADRCHLKYHEYSVSADFQDIVNGIVTAFDEPFADDSVIPSFYVSKVTSEKVKVALSGLGGDELFAGYHRYFGIYLSDIYDHLPGMLHNNILSPLVNSMPEPKNSGDRINHFKRFTRYAGMEPARRYLGYVSTLDEEERRALYRPEMARNIDYRKTADFVLKNYEHCQSDNVVDKVLYTDIKTYLPDDILTLSDRLSMWHSLELRVPFVDHKLVELAATLPAKYKINLLGKKRLLKQVASRWLPREIINHRKQGFESPMAGWLRNELFDYTSQLLSHNNIEKTGLFNYEFVSQKMDAHFSGKEKNNKIIFSLMMFVLWHQKNMC